jgi:hypothetical protein
MSPGQRSILRNLGNQSREASRELGSVPSRDPSRDRAENPGDILGAGRPKGSIFRNRALVAEFAWFASQHKHWESLVALFDDKFSAAGVALGPQGVQIRRRVRVDEMQAACRKLGYKGDVEAIYCEIQRLSRTRSPFSTTASSGSAAGSEAGTPGAAPGKESPEEPPVSLREFKHFQQQATGSSHSHSCVEHFAAMLEKRRGAVLRSWRLDLDFHRTGAVTYKQFGHALRLMNLQGQAKHLWGCFRPLGERSEASSVRSPREASSVRSPREDSQTRVRSQRIVHVTISRVRALLGVHCICRVEVAGKPLTKFEAQLGERYRVAGCSVGEGLIISLMAAATPQMEEHLLGRAKIDSTDISPSWSGDLTLLTGTKATGTVSLEIEVESVEKKSSDGKAPLRDHGEHGKPLELHEIAFHEAQNLERFLDLFWSPDFGFSMERAWAAMRPKDPSKATMAEFLLGCEMIEFDGDAKLLFAGLANGTPPVVDREVLQYVTRISQRRERHRGKTEAIQEFAAWVESEAGGLPSLLAKLGLNGGKSIGDQEMARALVVLGFPGDAKYVAHQVARSGGNGVSITPKLLVPFMTGSSRLPEKMVQQRQTRSLTPPRTALRMRDLGTGAWKNNHADISIINEHRCSAAKMYFSVAGSLALRKEDKNWCKVGERAAYLDYSGHGRSCSVAPLGPRGAICRAWNSSVDSTAVKNSGLPQGQRQYFSDPYRGRSQCSARSRHTVRSSSARSRSSVSPRCRAAAASPSSARSRSADASQQRSPSPASVAPPSVTSASVRIGSEVRWEEGCSGSDPGRSRSPATSQSAATRSRERSRERSGGCSPRSAASTTPSFGAYSPRAPNSRSPSPQRVLAAQNRPGVSSPGSDGSVPPSEMGPSGRSSPRSPRSPISTCRSNRSGVSSSRVGSPNILLLVGKMADRRFRQELSQGKGRRAMPRPFR